MYALFDDYGHEPMVFAEEMQILIDLACKRMPFSLNCYIRELYYENGIFFMEGDILWERRNGRIVFDVYDSRP